MINLWFKENFYEPLMKISKVLRLQRRVHELKQELEKEKFDSKYARDFVEEVIRHNGAHVCGASGFKRYPGKFCRSCNFHFAQRLGYWLEDKIGYKLEDKTGQRIYIRISTIEEILKS